MTAVETKPFSSAPDLVLPTLAVLGFLAVRPNVFGEQYANAGLTAFVIIGALVLVRDRGHSRWLRSSGVVLLAFVATVMWTAARAEAVGVSLEAVLVGGITGLLILASFGLLIADRGRAVAFARILFVVVAVVSASSVVTAAMAASVGSIPLAEIAVRGWTYTLSFPFTPSVATQSVLGVALPRFTGIAREPGWMSMYAAFAWALWPFVMRRGKFSAAGRIACALGVFTPVSTAGFGIFIVVLCLEVFIRPRPGSNLALGYFRQLAGVAAILFAGWLAISAPVLGLEAKRTQNEASLEGRNLATEQGLSALGSLSLGEPSSIISPNVNLIAAASVNGWPFLLLGALAILGPLLFTRSASRAAPSVLIVFLTLLLAQPIGGSHAVYMLVMLACAVAEHTAPARPAPIRRHEPAAVRGRVGAVIQPVAQRLDRSTSRTSARSQGE